MCKKYSQEEVNRIVQEALEIQLDELEKEKRLQEIESAILAIQKDITDLKEKKIGF